MDSLTQIVLGAACGEITLGKKIGNKAILFGAIGGTIPDLDVFTSRWIYTNEIDILAAHRGFSHSILFSVLGGLLFGYLFFWLYNKGKRQGTTTLTNWIWLFFLALFTHIVLDCFTPYGTQVFLPFSDYRVAFNTISVIDPAYTLPFLIGLIVILLYKRHTPRRKLWLRLALGISSAYMLFTIGNKFYINRIFKKALITKGIPYERYTSQPTILNNMLWYSIAESNDAYYVSFYSMFDASSSNLSWKRIPKNHSFMDTEHPDIQKLKWFSNGYFNFESLKGDEELRYNDLRYIMLSPDNTYQFVFSFLIFKENERYNTKPFYAKTPSKRDFEFFIKRIKGE